MRQDVIAKIIFRSFRKYYMKEFKSFFDFSKWRRDSNSDTQGELLRKINSYIENNFRSIEYEYLGIFLLAVIDIKDKFINIGQRLRDLKENITGLLYSYNKLKMVGLIKNREFALLLYNFLNKQQILEKMVKSRDNQELIIAYTEQIQCFKAMWVMAMRE